MESIRNLIVIVLIFGLVGLVIYAVGKDGFDGLMGKDELEIKDYSYSLSVTDPEGREVGRFRIHGELSPKIRNGFYLKDVGSGVILDFQNDGSVSYFMQHRK
jgi:hypothetical protein